MKKLKTMTLALALLLSATAPSRLGAQTLLRVKVVNEAEHPLAGVSFRIAFVGDYRSDPNGERSLTLPQDLRPGQPLAFELKNDTLAIWSPAAGKDKVPDRDPIVLKLLPKGDHRLLNRDEMKQVMNKLISEAAKKATALLQAEKAKLEQQLAGAPGDPLTEEAQRLGFSKEQLLAAIDQVKQQLQESDDPYEAGLAKLYDKKYPQAAELIARSIAQDEKLIRAAEEKKEKLPEKWLNVANAYVGEHKLKEAVEAYKKAIALQPKKGDGYFLLGNVFHVMGNAQGVLKNWKNALVIYRKENALANAGVVLGNLGQLFNDWGQFDSARVYLQAALKTHREIGDQRSEAATVGSLGHMMSAFGHLNDALVYLRVAVKIYREIGDHQSEASALGHLGLVFNAWGQFDSARVYLEAALKFYRKIGYRQGEASTLDQLGLMFSALGKLDSAWQCYGAALKIAREIRDQRGEATALDHLGQVLSALGRPDNARDCHQAALQIYRKIGDRRGESSAISNLGNVFSTLGQPDSARVYLKAALKSHYLVYNFSTHGFADRAMFLPPHGFPDTAIVRGLRAFGNYESWVKMNYDSAHVVTLKIARQLGNSLDDGTRHSDIGLVYRALGQLEDARSQIQSALRIHHEIGYRQGEAKQLGNLVHRGGSISIDARLARACLDKSSETASPWCD